MGLPTPENTDPSAMANITFCDRANVGRSTFYSHFTTKDELLLSSIEHLLEMLNQYNMNFIEHGGDKSRLIPVVELLEHITENSRLMKGLIKAKSADLFFDKVQAYWNKKIEEYLCSKLHNPPLEQAN